MSELLALIDLSTPVKSLKHYGKKGMRWGVRKADSVSSGPTDVVVKTAPGQRVKTAGGTGHSPHPDAIKSAAALQKARKSTVDSLSNDELNTLIKRVELETKYSKILAQKSQRTGVHKFVHDLITKVGKDEMNARMQGKNGQLTTALLAAKAARETAKYAARHA